MNSNRLILLHVHMYIYFIIIYIFIYLFFKTPSIVTLFLGVYLLKIKIKVRRKRLAYNFLSVKKSSHDHHRAPFHRVPFGSSSIHNLTSQFGHPHK